MKSWTGHLVKAGKVTSTGSSGQARSCPEALPAVVLRGRKRTFVRWRQGWGRREPGLGRELWSSWCVRAFSNLHQLESVTQPRAMISKKMPGNNNTHLQGCRGLNEINPESANTVCDTGFSGRLVMVWGPLHTGPGLTWPYCLLFPGPQRASLPVSTSILNQRVGSFLLMGLPREITKHVRHFSSLWDTELMTAFVISLMGKCFP